MQITDTNVYNLKEAIISVRNSMLTEMPEDTQENFSKGLERAIKLSKNENSSGHKNFLSGILVSFNITYPQYWSMEAQRYHFLQIVSSSSKMHRLTKMDIRTCCNKYVRKDVMDILQNEIDRYNAEPTSEHFMSVISNCPMGLELFMHCTTNYLQLSTIYKQRRNHKLEDWQIFCNWIETLPYFEELIKQ